MPRLGFARASDEALKASAAVMNKQLARLDEHLRGPDYLVGDSLTLADLFLVPIVFWIEKPPEGMAALPANAAFSRWCESMQQRGSYKNTIPSMPG